ncbi:MAG: hypothetical protein RLZZ546_977 [Bacteroidota bacterium]|jgi:hypothetical protein
MKEFTLEEELAFEALMDRLDEIANENDLQTLWSVEEITDVYKEIGIQPKYITNGIESDVRVELPNTPLTWLDLWKASDELYKLLGDVDHKFIEEFEVKTENGETFLEVFFGS